MNQSLTSGAIKALVGLEANTMVDPNFKPILQVINIKLVGKNKGGGDRYRAVLSDGTHFVQGMLATQLNQLVNDGQLKEDAVIQAQELLKNVVQNRNVIILLKLNMLYNPGHRIGNPVDIEQNMPAGSAQTHIVPAAQPLYNSTNNTGMMVNHNNTYNSGNIRPPSMNAYDGGMAPSPPRIASNNNSNPYGKPALSPPGGSNPYAASYPQQAHAPIVRSANVAGTAITPIAALNIYNSRWTIRARLTNKSDIRTWSNPKGEGSLFSIELLDSSGVDIRGTFFKEAVDKFYNMLEVGKIYRISGGRLKVADVKWNTCKSAFEITFDQNTEFHLDNDDGEIAQANYDFVRICDIENIEPNKNVDVLAVVKSVGDVANIVSKKTGQEMAKCDLILADDSGAEISLTVWREKAVTAPTEYANNPIVAFRRARVSDYGGRCLSAGSSVDINPDIPQARQLQQWWLSGGARTSSTRSLSTRAGGGGRAPAFEERKGIAAIRDEHLGQQNMDKGDFLSFKGTITFFKKDREDGAWYTACANAGEPCRNRFKVTPTPDGRWQCDKCHGIFDNCVRRWIFSGVVEDETSSTWVSFFNEQAETMMKTTADEAYARTHENGAFDQNAYDGYFFPALFSEWVFRCRVKNEMVNEDSRVKTSVMSMYPVDYLQESKDLLAAIEKF